jgi:hypothetical protein
VSIEVSGISAASCAATGPYFGSIYAPQAELSVSSTFEVFGFVVAKTLLLEAGAKLHFDQYLGVLSDQEGLPANLSWQLLELAGTGDGAINVDPFEILGVVEEDLPVPAEAHEDQLLQIEYLDDAGNLASYSGLESNFDWDVVDEVIEAYRDGKEATFETVSDVKGCIIEADG